MKYTDTQSLLDHRKTSSELIIPTVSHTKPMTVIVKVFLNVWSASLSDQMQQKSSTMLLQFKPPLHRCHWEGRVCRHHLVAHILITNMAWYQDHTKVKVNVITHTVSTVQWCIHAEMDSFNKSRETAGESQTWADTSLTDTQFKWIWCWWTCVFSHTRPPTSQHPRPVCSGVSAQLLKLQTFHWNISLMFLLRVVTCTLVLGTTPWMLDSMEWLFSVAIIFSSLADTLPARPVHCFYCLLAFCSTLTLMPRFFSFILEPQRESFFCCYLTPLCLTLWRILPYSIVTAFFASPGGEHVSLYTNVCFFR